MSRRISWSVALGAAVLLPLGALAPVATATAAAAPSAAPTQSRQTLVEIPAQAALRDAVTPSECSTTLLDDYVDGLFADMTDAQFAFLVQHQDVLLNVPTYDALFFGTAGDPDYALDSHAAQLSPTPTATCSGSGTSSPTTSS